MKVEGTEKEMRNLFREKKKSTLFSDKPINKRYWFYLAIVGILLVIAFFIFTIIQWNDNRITKLECNNLIEQAQMQNIDSLTIKDILIIYKPQISLLVVLIGLAWLLHGVGFRIL